MMWKKYLDISIDTFFYYYLGIDTDMNKSIRKFKYFLGTFNKKMRETGKKKVISNVN